MMTKIPKGGASRAGSCSGLVDYLEKEKAGHWISQDRELLAGHEVVAAIDGNKRDLSKTDDKYYQLVISPSQKEVAHLGNDPQKLTAFVRGAMEEYADNFRKGLAGKDLVWFAKVEHTRSHTHQERAVQLGEIDKGTPKEGHQTHIHVIVSRMENLAIYQAKKESGALALTAQGKPRRAYKLSPLSHHQDTAKGPVKGGFGRNRFSEAVESQFDKQFDYQRPLTESFRYLHAMKYGTDQAKEALQQETALQKAPKKAQELSKSFLGLELRPLAKSSPAAHIELKEQLSRAFKHQDRAALSEALGAALAQVDKTEQAQQEKQEKETIKQHKIKRSPGFSL
jgi:hypothetical protein